MPSTRNSEFRPETYLRLTTIIKSRLNTIRHTLETKYLERDVPLNGADCKTLKNYVADATRKHNDFQLNLERAMNYHDEDSIPIESLVADEESISESFIFIVSNIEDLLSQYEQPQSSSNTTNVMANTNTLCSARLPKIELPKFSGDYTNWTNFINVFNTAIHSNSGLNNVTKFQYLLSVLSGEPLNLIKNLSLTESNYDVAYQIIFDRYQNDRRLVLLHLNTLLDLPDVCSRNIVGIREFLNSYHEHVQALTAIQYDVTTSNHLFSALLLRKLDLDLRKRLEACRESTSNKAHTLPIVSEIIDFLSRECSRHEDAVSSVTSQMKHLNVPNHNKQSRHHNIPTKPVFSTIAEVNKRRNCCGVCKQADHKLFMCPTFLKKSPRERYKLVKTCNQCISCLGHHDVKNCTSQSLCKTCSKRHNTLLHFGPTNHSSNVDVPVNSHRIPSATQIVNTRPQSSNITTETSVPASNDESITCHSQMHLNSSRSYTVLLGTLLVNVTGLNGNRHTFRALLDSGSMSSLISERAANILQTPRQRCSQQIMGINQSISRNKGQIVVNIATRFGVTLLDNHTMVVLDKLTLDLPRCPISSEIVSRLQHEQLADPMFYTPNRIDVILGAQLIPFILTGAPQSLGTDLPSVIDTPCGKIVIGTTPCYSPSSPNQFRHTSTLNVCLHSLSSLNDIHDSIQRFWIQEEVPTPNIKSDEDDACEELFANTHYRDVSGRYVVRLPFKDSLVPLGSSVNAAQQRLEAMERKFAKNDRFADLYKEFMNEYLLLGHMTAIDTPSANTTHYFLPHHGVLKESSSTTKLRTVFDASCKTSSGYSLNDALMVGPRLQTNVSDILIHFRRYNVVLCCDIKQMYRQILINPADRNHQLILWRDNIDQPAQTYQLNTVTYGVNCSPFLALRTLQQLATDEKETYPLAANAVLHHTYVDDIITGCDTVEDAAMLKDQLTDLLMKGQFELRKWISNSEEILQQIPKEHRETPKFISDSCLPQFTVLGLQWSPTSDAFSYATHIRSTTVAPTKRTILSAIAQIYDPCGFLTPFVMIAKRMMQLIWTLGVNWDSPLPDTITTQWNRFMNDMPSLSNIIIPRSLNISQSQKIELHGFADASENGYAAAVYFKSTDKNDFVSIKLVVAKSRVAPLKRVTLPRLELCAAHLLSRLVTHCMTLFPNMFHCNNIFLWSDSMIVLTWIRTPSFLLKTFVANRVAQIQELQPTTIWHHVASTDNPADCGSRGILVSQLVDNALWWSGPTWLSQPSHSWPIQQIPMQDISNSPETKLVPLSVLTSSSNDNFKLLTSYSSWMKLVRITAFILRFLHNCSQPHNHIIGFITTSELDNAKLKVFYAVQQSCFKREFSELSSGICPSIFRKLNPFIDHKQLMRVGGRLRNSQLPHDVKHPILMPKHHHVVDILIDYWHLTYLHAGPLLIQSLLMQTVWIINARNVIRHRIHKCLTCFKQRPIQHTPFMADLPSMRSTPAKPFMHSGTDFMGPFNVKPSRLRCDKLIKVYVCLFICMVTKAVHLEVVTDMTTDAFIAALNRFIARRGICLHIYSDCGTNFKGANSELRKIIHSTVTNSASKTKIYNQMSSTNIQFHFNPPAAPHHGGLWERSVQSVKHHLNRVMGNHTLLLMEFITLVTKIEAILNSRPLTPMSSDPHDLAVLTPGHFLTGAPLVALPEPELTDLRTNRLDRWQLVQQFSQLLWKRWRLEYLHQLQQRHKWTINQENPHINDLVLLRTPSSPLNWPTARVIEVFPGKDNVVRVVKIRTNDGTYVRPITQLCPLPLEQ